MQKKEATVNKPQWNKSLVLETLLTHQNQIRRVKWDTGVTETWNAIPGTTETGRKKIIKKPTKQQNKLGYPRLKHYAIDDMENDSPNLMATYMRQIPFLTLIHSSQAASKSRKSCQGLCQVSPSPSSISHLSSLEPWEHRFLLFPCHFTWPQRLSSFTRIFKHLLNLDMLAVGLMLNILFAFEAHPPLPNPAWALQLYQATLRWLPRSSPIAFSKVFSPMWKKSSARTVTAPLRQRAGTDLVPEVLWTQDSGLRKMPAVTTPESWAACVTASLCICSLSHLQTLCAATHLYCTFLSNRCMINDCYLLGV